MKKQPDIALVNLKAQADSILDDMANLDDALTRLREQHKNEIARINAVYTAEMSPIIAEIQGNEVEIKRLMKSAKDTLFADADIVYLDHGNLLYEKDDRVTIPRDALAKCEAQGFTEAIKIAKSLDRDAINKWPDEKLVMIGAERKAVETFNYEVKSKNKDVVSIEHGRKEVAV